MRMAAARSCRSARFPAQSALRRASLPPSPCQRACRGVGNGCASACGQPSRISAHQTQRLDDLLEAHHDARRDVAIAVRGHAHLELVIGRAAGTARADPRPAPLARPASPVSPICAASSGAHTAAV